ncbi:MAG: hypothetical protein Q8902_08010 [Bacteroidota bacterium]|nr:hypothetical protein [Bacteroidota bacterium]MDP4232933.1 hypothetical protein [Bacteroidota bacterium]MDP4241977.1 hypothetical protein [Bacteroidota bacterium]
MRAAVLSIILSLLGFATVRAQVSGKAGTTAPMDTNRSSPSRDTTLSNSPHAEGLWRRPQADRNDGDLYVTGEAMRYYASPSTPAAILEATGGPFPLMLGEEAYGRESFELTARTSESLISTLIDGILPINSILNGANLSNYYPLDAFDDFRVNSASPGASMTGSDYAASDVTNASLERFRAPVPYSRVHYTQDLLRSFSDFDGIFSLNATQGTNITLGVHRRSAGHAPVPNDLSFDPRADLWSARGSMSFTKYLGTIPHDSTWTQHRIDSLLATSDARRHTLDFYLWGQYTTAFSGLSGGIASRDSIDIFNEQLAPMIDPNTFDHRVRMDAIAKLDLPLLAEARTTIAAFASGESRRILSADSTFPIWLPELTTGTRYGASLSQPIGLSVGDFLTRAMLRGDIELTSRDSQSTFTPSVRETRLAAMFSDSLALRTALRVSIFGFVRTVESNLSLDGGPVSSLVLPSLGLAASVGVTNALSFSASYHYAKDRAALSPSPDETYQLQNIGAWMDLRVPFSRGDSIAIHAGVLDRHEPEGIVDVIAADSIHAHPRFSNTPLHTQSASAAIDAYVSHFHFGYSLTYFPSLSPMSAYATAFATQNALPRRFFGWAGIYYENELAEGNLRLVAGPRVRFTNTLNPQLTYDPASDYYVYRGWPASTVDSATTFPMSDSRINTPKYVIDVLLSAELDRRAQVNLSLLNILSTPYYNVSIYPRPGFHWRLDVTWAFLD